MQKEREVQLSADLDYINSDNDSESNWVLLLKELQKNELQFYHELKLSITQEQSRHVFWLMPLIIPVLFVLLFAISPGASGSEYVAKSMSLLCFSSFLSLGVSHGIKHLFHNVFNTRFKRNGQKLNALKDRIMTHLSQEKNQHHLLLILENLLAEKVEKIDIKRYEDLFKIKNALTHSFVAGNNKEIFNQVYQLYETMIIIKSEEKKINEYLDFMKKHEQYKKEHTIEKEKELQHYL